MLWTQSSIESWLNGQSSSVQTPDVSNPAKKQKQLDKDKKRRLAAAREALEKHRKPK